MVRRFAWKKVAVIVIPLIYPRPIRPSTITIHIYILFTLLINLSELQDEGTYAKFVFLEKNYRYYREIALVNINLTI